MFTFADPIARGAAYYAFLSNFCESIENGFRAQRLFAQWAKNPWYLTCGCSSIAHDRSTAPQHAENTHPSKPPSTDPTRQKIHRQWPRGEISGLVSQRVLDLRRKRLAFIIEVSAKLMRAGKGEHMKALLLSLALVVSVAGSALAAPADGKYTLQYPACGRPAVTPVLYLTVAQGQVSVIISTR